MAHSVISRIADDHDARQLPFRARGKPVAASHETSAGPGESAWMSSRKPDLRRTYTMVARLAHQGVSQDHLERVLREIYREGNDTMRSALLESNAALSALGYGTAVIPIRPQTEALSPFCPQTLRPVTESSPPVPLMSPAHLVCARTSAVRGEGHCGNASSAAKRRVQTGHRQAAGVGGRGGLLAAAEWAGCRAIPCISSRCR